MKKFRTILAAIIASAGIFTMGCSNGSVDDSAIALLPQQQHQENPVKIDKGKIFGKVVYSNAEDSSGITVTLETTDGIRAIELVDSVNIPLPAETRGIIGSNVTKRDGSYSFDNLNPGTYTIYASSNNTSERAVMTNVVVTAGKTVTASDLNLTATGSINGKVTLGESETESYGFIIYIAGTSYSAMTKKDGGFEITGIPAGNDYALIIQKGLYTYFWNSGIEVKASEVTEIKEKNFTLEELSTGVFGKDGTSIIWLGSFDNAPENPSELNAYFNMKDGCSYIYNGVSWNLLAKRGAAGVKGDKGDPGSVSQKGDDGKSMIWLGSFPVAPAFPDVLSAYYNTLDGCSYIYNGLSWDLLASKGAMGEKGDSGENGSKGETGEAGTSIMWLGSFDNAPENPSELNAYYNTTYNCSYIYIGTSWKLFAGNERIPAPTFSVASGIVGGGTSVAINCVVEGVTIYYTTDGSDPTKSSYTYNGTPFSITSAMTIKAFAVKDGIGESFIARASYTIKYQPTYQFTQSVRYFMKAGSSATYAEFGDWPQSEAAAGVLFSSTPEDNGWYVGNDGNYYAKVTKNDPYRNGDNYTDEVVRYFKVEPIRWRVLTNDYKGNKLLLAENVLLSGVPYYERTDSHRNGSFANNYKDSQIRAYLNGIKYNAASINDEDKWLGKGFLQTAFTPAAQEAIAITEVDNSGESTTDEAKNYDWANGKKKDGITDSGYPDYTCDNTMDKIFILSVQEMTASEYGFDAPNSYTSVPARNRELTDYSRELPSTVAYSLLRSPASGPNSYSIYTCCVSSISSLFSVTGGGQIVPALTISF